MKDDWATEKARKFFDEFNKFTGEPGDVAKLLRAERARSKRIVRNTRKRLTGMRMMTGKEVCDDILDRLAGGR